MEKSRKRCSKWKSPVEKECLRGEYVRIVRMASVGICRDGVFDGDVLTCECVCVCVWTR